MCDIRSFDTENTAVESGSGVQTFLDELLLALQNSRIYRPDHPRVVESLRALSTSLDCLLTELGSDAFQLGAADGYLFYDKRPLLSSSRSAPRLLRIFESLESGGITFHRGIQPLEFLTLAQFLARRDIETLDLLEANLELELGGCRNVRFLAQYTEGAQAEGESPTPQDGAGEHPTLQIPARMYQDVFDHLTDIVTSVFRGNLFRLDDTKGHVEKILKSLSTSPSAVMTVSHYEHTDADQFQFRHSIRVACLALGFARGLTHDEDFLQRIGSAALLHDVGKGRLDDWSILHHPGRLTDEQRVEMGRHAELGARLLLDIEDSDPMAVTIAFGHHQTLPGGGYPRTLHLVDMSKATRLVKICDVYEALTARRPYKDPISPTRSYRIMLNMNRESGGAHFDAELLHRFVLVNGIYPAGSWVRLDSHELACVQGQTQDLEQPIVSVEREEGLVNGEKALFATKPRKLDLREQDQDGTRRRVLEWVGYTEPEATQVA